jgi:exosortase A-associated hydrolase 2
VADLKAFYLPASHGARFCLLHTPEHQEARGSILFVHPFAEEMNKSRRMAAVQAKALANSGWTVLQLDLLGCGDSSGDFSDATWQAWIDDVLHAARWLRASTGHQPVLWGLRTGCLLITHSARYLDGPLDLLLWHPVLSGKRFLQQFLRIAVASESAAPNGSRPSHTQDLRQQLAEGFLIEVAGYPLSPALALPLEAAGFEMPTQPARVAWIELGAADNDSLLPASREVVTVWQQAGHVVSSRVVDGPPFWHTQDISECPDLVHVTVSLLDPWRQ